MSTSGVLLHDREQQREAESGEEDLIDQRQQDLDDDARGDCGAIERAQQHEPDTDDFAADAGDGHQAAHRLAHGRDPEQEGPSCKTLRIAGAKQRAPAFRIERQRQGVERDNPQKPPAGSSERLKNRFIALMRHEGGQRCEPQSPCGKGEGVRGKLHATPWAGQKSEKPPRLRPRPSISARTCGDSSAANSSVGRYDAIDGVIPPCVAGCK